MNAEEVIRLLGLVPHPSEGGYFVETYRAPETLPRVPGSGGCGDARSLSTAIYFLVTPGAFSALHRLPADEIFHFYCGDPVEMMQLHPAGQGEFLTLGPRLDLGQRPQVLVPRGVWQGSRLFPGGSFALLGTTMAPGFDPSDYEAGDRGALSAAWPAFADRIAELTR